MRRRTPIRAEPNTVGCKIRCARRRTGLTQAALAEQMRARAKSTPAFKSTTLEQLISRLELGKPIIYQDRVLKSLTEILGPLDAGETIDMMTHYSRPVAIDISRDGTVTYRRWDTPPLRKGFPIFSVFSEEEARRLQICLCQEIPIPDPRLPGKRWFAFVKFTEAILAGRDFGDLLGPTVLEFAEAYEKLRFKVEGRASLWPRRQ